MFKNVLISGVGSLIGYSVLSMLKKSRYKPKVIVGTDYFNNHLGLYEVDKAELLPDILKKNVTQKIWLQKLIKIINKYNVQLLIPALDFELKLYSKYKDFIEKKTGCYVLISSMGIIDIFSNKRKTIDFLKNNNLPHPKIFSVDEIKKKFFNNSKLIIKPTIGSTSEGVSIVNNIDELREKIKKVKNPVIQEYIKGKEFTCGCFYLNNKILSISCMSRFLKNGNTEFAKLENNTKIINFLKKFEKFQGFIGSINFQLKLYKNKVYIFEINPRFSGTSYARHLFGINEYDLFVEEYFKYKKNKKKLNNGYVIKSHSFKYVKKLI